METIRKVALYARVSTEDQNVETQTRILQQWARDNTDRLGTLRYEYHVDRGFSGGTIERPGYQRMVRECRTGTVSAVIATRVDRLSRSLADFALLADELRSRDIDLILTEQQFDSSTPMGEAMMGMLAVFAQFERRMISERTKEGIARVREQGRAHWGRQGPLHHDPDLAEMARTMLQVRPDLAAHPYALASELQKLRPSIMFDGRHVKQWLKEMHYGQ